MYNVHILPVLLFDLNRLVYRDIFIGIIHLPPHATTHVDHPHNPTMPMPVLVGILNPIQGIEKIQTLMKRRDITETEIVIDIEIKIIQGKIYNCFEQNISFVLFIFCHHIL